jgi:hypothetical protein
MPPLATSVVDRQAVGLIHDWIEQFEVAGPPNVTDRK